MVPRHRVIDAITIETVGSDVVTFLLMPISEESPYETVSLTGRDLMLVLVKVARNRWQLFNASPSLPGGFLAYAVAGVSIVLSAVLFA